MAGHISFEVRKVTGENEGRLVWLVREWVPGASVGALLVVLDTLVEEIDLRLATGDQHLAEKLQPTLLKLAPATSGSAP